MRRIKISHAGLSLIKSPTVFLCCILLGLTPLATLAQEEDLEAFYGEEDMIALATGIEQPIHKAPAVASVITAKQIKAMGATDIDEVLETIPGLHVSRNSNSDIPLYAIRGALSTYNTEVLFLINGIPVTNAFVGNRSQIWGGMPVEAISRVEVVRGPGSAIYGAEALSGVINIVTKTGQEIHGTEGGVRLGSFDTEDYWFLHGDNYGEFEAAIMLEVHRTDGYDRTIDADLQTTLDGIFGTSASLAPGDMNNQKDNYDLRFDLGYKEWRLRGGLQHREIGSGVGVADSLDPVGDQSSDRWNIDLTWHDPVFTENWDIKAQASYFNTSQIIEEALMIFPPGANLGLGPFPNGMLGAPEVFEQHSRINLTAAYNGFERHAMRAGIGFHYADLYKVQDAGNFQEVVVAPGVVLYNPLPGIIDRTDTTQAFLTEGARKNHYGFVQDVWSFAPDWELTAGIRYDDYSDFGHTWNPRIALVWATSFDLTTKLLYGEAFRTPSFAESRTGNNPASNGNGSLSPETVQTLELAFDYHPLSPLQGKLNLFYYERDDIIDLDNTNTWQNQGSQRGYGAEVEATWELTDDLILDANYAFQRTDDRTTNSEAGLTPEHQFFVQANWLFMPNWSLNTSANFVLDRARKGGDTRNEVDDYTWVNLSLRRTNIMNNFEAALHVKNLFNDDAREPTDGDIPDDLPLADRSILGEIRVAF